jgi:hypothetical protein
MINGHSTLSNESSDSQGESCKLIINGWSLLSSHSYFIAQFLVGGWVEKEKKSTMKSTIKPAWSIAASNEKILWDESAIRQIYGGGEWRPSGAGKDQTEDQTYVVLTESWPMSIDCQVIVNWEALSVVGSCARWMCLNRNPFTKTMQWDIVTCLKLEASFSVRRCYNGSERFAFSTMITRPAFQSNKADPLAKHISRCSPISLISSLRIIRINQVRTASSTLTTCRADWWDWQLQYWYDILTNLSLRGKRTASRYVNWFFGSRQNRSNKKMLLICAT